MSDSDEKRQRENRFWREAFLAVLPASMEVDGWTSGTDPISDVSSRVDLAADFATNALRSARNKKRI